MIRNISWKFDEDCIWFSWEKVCPWVGRVGEFFSKFKDRFKPINSGPKQPCLWLIYIHHPQVRSYQLLFYPKPDKKFTVSWPQLSIEELWMNVEIIISFVSCQGLEGIFIALQGHISSHYYISRCLLVMMVQEMFCIF